MQINLSFNGGNNFESYAVGKDLNDEDWTPYETIKIKVYASNSGARLRLKIIRKDSYEWVPVVMSSGWNCDPF